MLDFRLASRRLGNDTLAFSAHPTLISTRAPVAKHLQLRFLASAVIVKNNEGNDFLFTLKGENSFQSSKKNATLERRSDETCDEKLHLAPILGTTGATGTTGGMHVCSGRTNVCLTHNASMDSLDVSGLVV